MNNKSHVAARSAARARSAAAAARLRQTLLDLDESDEIEVRESDELDDVGEGRQMAAILDVDEDDETETGDINLLLHGYR
jgi:hypothetical protein